MRWLLRLYPATWRRRYGDEFLALIESQPGSPGLVLDVLLGVMDAWLRPQVAPTGSPAPVGGAAVRRRADRFDKFTPRSRSVLQFAAKEAELLGHDFIGTEHLLLGLLHEPEGVAMGVLHGLDVDPASLRSAVEGRVGSIVGGGRRDRGLTLRAKRAIELSVDEANRLRHSYVGTEHLLLGLLREGEGVAAEVLTEMAGADVAEVRRRVVRVLNRGS